MVQHGEEAYARGEGAVLVPPDVLLPLRSAAAAPLTLGALEVA